MLPIQFQRYAGLKACAAAAVALVLAGAVAPAANAQHAGLFAHLGGNWSGTGTILTSSGVKERIRCTATYAVGEGGHAVGQNLRCASDSYRFFVTSDVHEDGGKLSGSWQETTRGASGQLSGRATENQIVGTVSGVGFNAALSLITHGSSQMVSIRPGGAADIIEVAVHLRRR